MPYALVLLVLALAACGPTPPAPVPTDNTELATLAAEDQAVRMGKADASSDDARRRRVIELLALGQVATPQDKFNAGLVLQHTGLTLCDGTLTSLSAENYLLAHELFKAAMAEGVAGAPGLVAATIDRYLSFTVGTQKYGTNRIIDQDTGEEQLVPIDRSVSDAERARYGVPPLDSLLARWPEAPRLQ